MTRYVTFGQDHRHEIGGVVFDSNCVAKVDGDRAKVFEIFGPKFCMEYTEEVFTKSVAHWPYLRGIIEVTE